MRIAIVATMLIILSAPTPLFAQTQNTVTVIAGIPVPQEILYGCSHPTIEYSNSNPEPVLIFTEKDDPGVICAKLTKDKPPVFQPPKWVEKTIDWGKRHHPTLQIGCFKSQDISFSLSPFSGSIMMVCKF